MEWALIDGKVEVRCGFLECLATRLWETILDLVFVCCTAPQKALSKGKAWGDAAGTIRGN